MTVIFFGITLYIGKMMVTHCFTALQSLLINLITSILGMLLIYKKIFVKQNGSEELRYVLTTVLLVGVFSYINMNLQTYELSMCGALQYVVMPPAAIEQAFLRPSLSKGELGIKGPGGSQGPQGL